MEYPWYESLLPFSHELLQGDLIPSCPIVVLPKSLEPNGEIDVDIVEYNVVVVSQSCDLENGKVENVLVCPYYTFQHYITDVLKQEERTNKAIKRHFEEMQRGNQPNYHLLNKDESKGLNDYIFVDFRNVFAVHIDFLSSHLQTIESRVRLLPPYREHLSQAFARFFMRVGLPQNIPPVDPEIYLPKK